MRSPFPGMDPYGERPYRISGKSDYTSFQKVLVREKLGWLKLISRRENCPIPFLKRVVLCLTKTRWTVESFGCLVFQSP